MGLVLGSLVVGFVIHVLWPDAFGPERDRPIGRRIFIGAAAFAAILIAVGYLCPYLGDCLREWGTLAARLMFGAAIGYAAAHFVRTREDKAAHVIAATLGIAVLLLVVSSVYNVERLADRLSGIDTPLVKIQLAAVVPRRDTGETRVEFLNSNYPAASAAIAAAQAIPVMVNRSEQFALLARYLVPGQTVKEYPDNETRAFVRGLAMPFAKCVAGIHAAAPGDEKRFVLSDRFVEYFLHAYRESLRKRRDGHRKLQRIKIRLINREVSSMMERYEYYSSDRDLLRDDRADTLNCLTFTSYLRGFMIFLANIQNKSPPMPRLPSSASFHFPFLVASILASRDMPSEASGELLAWLNTTGDAREQASRILEPQSADAVFEALTTLYLYSWTANHAEQGQDYAARTLGERSVLENFDSLVAANSVLSSLISASTAPDGQAWTLDGECRMTGKVRELPAPPNGGHSKDETYDTIALAVRVLSSIYMVRLNNHLYEAWLSSREMARDERDRFSALHLGRLENYDYDCFATENRTDAISSLLSIAETFIVVKLSLVSQIQGSYRDRVRREVCALARHHNAWKKAVDELESMTPAYPTALERHGAMTVGDQLNYVAARQDRLETVNLLRDRLSRIERLVLSLNDSEEVTFETAYDNVCPRRHAS